MLTEDQRMQMMYTGVSAFRNTEVTLQWSRSLLFTAVNSVAIPFSAQITINHRLNVMIGFGGFLLCFFWLWVNAKSQRYIEYWQSVLESMEPAQTNLLVLRIFTSSGWKSLEAWPNFHQILNILPQAFMAGWAMILGIHMSYLLPLFLK